MPRGLDNAYHTMCHMTSSTHQPCGLGCHFLGMHYYICGGNNPHHGHFALGGIISCPAPLLHSPERMATEYPPAENSDLGRERGTPEYTRIMQDGSYPEEVTEVVKSRVVGWAASFSMAQWEGLEEG